MLPVRDAELVQIVDAALADATIRARQEDGRSWLACRPGCTPCCHGVFRISALDGARLRSALGQLERTDSARALALRGRALALISRLRGTFPGNVETGILDPIGGPIGGPSGEPSANPSDGPDEAAWEAFADLPEADAPCPVLDPATGRCDLYTGRPFTCRVFGPPVMNEGGLGTCELCYIGASEEQILHGEMHLPPPTLEEELNAQLAPGESIIAWALLAVEL